MKVLVFFFLIHLHTEGHLGFFQVCTTVNKSAKNICVGVLGGYKISIYLGKHQRVCCWIVW